MSVQVQSLEGRTLFSGVTNGLLDPSSLPGLSSLSTVLSTLTQSGVSKSVISHLQSELNAASKTKVDAKALANFNVKVKTAFTDKKLTDGEILSIETSFNSVVQSEALAPSVAKSLKADFATVLNSKISVSQKQALLTSISASAGTFGKVKV